MNEEHSASTELQDGSSGSPQGFDPRIAQLRALVIVAKEGSYTRAARQLAYTESAVFLQIKALERLLGMPVVERRESRILLTPAGEVVHRYALRILGDVELMAREVAGLHGNRPIVVGGGRSTAVYYLTPLIAEFAREHPEYRVQLNIMSAEDLVSATEEGVLDLAATGGLRQLLVVGQRLKPGLRFTPWFRGSWALVLPRGVSDVRAIDSFYVPDFAWHLAPSMRRSIEEMGNSRPTLIEMTSGEAVKVAALHGLGAAVLPSGAITMEVARGLVEVRPLRVQRDSVMLVHRQPRLLTAGARELLRHLVNSRRRLSSGAHLGLLTAERGGDETGSKARFDV